MNPNKIRNVLNILFILVTLVAIVIYYMSDYDYKLFIGVCGAAVLIKIMEFFIRFTHR